MNAYREQISAKFSSEYEKDLYLSDVFSRCDLILEGIDPTPYNQLEEIGAW